MPQPAATDASVVVAERFIDAFYSFDRQRLARELASADSAAPRLLYYQGWAKGGQYQVVKGVEISDFSRKRMDATLKELHEERDGVKHLLS